MSKPHSILKVAISGRLWQVFDYKAPEFCPHPLTPGIRLRIPFGKREVIGLLLTTAEHSELPPDKLKTAGEILDQHPLFPPTLLSLCQWASAYYHHPIGDILLGTLPKGLRQGRALENKALHSSHPIKENFFKSLNAEQQCVLSKLTSQEAFKPFLLEGVTGSGKTEIYLHCIAHHLKQGKQALVLVPEIGLTPQTLARFRERFETPIFVMHSNLTDKLRMQTWINVLTHKTCIVIGTRSAIFMPFTQLGVIIVDEEHDLSYKQQSGFRYRARDVAIMRAKIENIPIILGTATPLLESYYYVQKNYYSELILPKRAGEARLPNIELIDLKKQTLCSGISVFLLNEIKKQLLQKGQILIFLNRRGFAPTLLCHHCGFAISCEHCDARMTLHFTPKLLICHYCGFQKKPPRICPQCKQMELTTLGEGTEKLELTLQTHFPQSNILRIDRDTTRKKNSLTEKLNLINNNGAQILIGTQMLAKGHHFPNLTLVAVIDADSGLFNPDFRATERMAQLLIQVAGRAGRENVSGKVFIQTYHPEHPMWTHLVKSNYKSYAALLLKERKITELPPYSYLALLRAESSALSESQNFLQLLKEKFNTENREVSIYGPLPALLERKAQKFRYQLLFRSKKRTALNILLKLLKEEIIKNSYSRKIKWSIDVDPQEF